MKNLIVTILYCLIPIFGIAQCGKFNIEVEDNSLIINQDSISLDCEADLDFFVEKIGDTINVYEINQNVLHDCDVYYNPFHNIILEIASFNSGSYILQLLYKFASNVNDTILCGQINFAIEPGFTSDSVYIKSWSINEITSTNVYPNKNETFRISQNVPNPFSQDTRINLFIPQVVNNSIIYFFDTFGRQKYIKEIKERGLFDLSVSYNFASGVYYYYISNDNFKSEVKKMIVAK